MSNGTSTKTNQAIPHAEAITREITRLLQLYLVSIDTCDTAAISALWLPSPQVSFIHPRGHERGFDEVARNFYGETMGANFSKRTLSFSGVDDPEIQVMGAALAVVTFDWDFVAVRKTDGAELRSSGRESHVYSHFDDHGWRLVHVHYSGPAVTGSGQGF